MPEAVNHFNVWNEERLLDRYQVFKYIYFMPIKTIFLQHLRELYKVYKIDFRFDLHALSIYSKMDQLQTKEIEFIQTNLLQDSKFQKNVFDLYMISLESSPYDSYNIDIFVFTEIRKRFEKRKNQKYTKLFKEISTQLLEHFKRYSISIAALDKVIGSFNIEKLKDVHIVPLLVSGLVRYILYEESKKK